MRKSLRGAAMNRSSLRSEIALLTLALLVGCGGHATPTNAVQDDALKALKSLRNSGVLSEAEYQAKVATLQGTGSAGLGDGASLDENPGRPDAARALGAPDNGAAGLSRNGEEFAGGTPARRASEPSAGTSVPQNTPRTAHGRLVRQADSRPDERANASQNGNVRVSSMRDLLAQARAKQEAAARSAHDLALRFLDRATHATPSAGQRAVTSQGAQALRSNVQGLLRSGDPSNANPGDTANQGFDAPAQR
jgi:hypothetical protein